MGRIADIIPALYHRQDNELIPFVDALDVEVKDLERNVRGITDLINVDKCPDDKLVYLAALTGCPLIGNDTLFWRRQIKNWPHILKLKGTQKSLELVLDSVGADSWDIKTFFRDAGGGYVTHKPDGKPFLDNSGLWCNIRTHYFGVQLTLSKNFVEKHDFNWDVQEVKEKLKFWFEHGKPYHAELLNLVILPPNLLPEGHFCRWDFCNWEHVQWKKYHWGVLIPLNPIFIHDPLTALSFERKINLIGDSYLWDFATWGSYPYRLLRIGQSSETAFFASLDDDVPTWLIPYSWDNFTWQDTGRVRSMFMSTIERDFQILPDIYVSESPFFTFNFFRGIHSDAFIQSVMQSGRYALTVLFSSLNDNSKHESIHFTHDIKRDISSFLDWSMSEPSFAAHDFFRAFICDLRPYWDVHSWLEHSIWTEEPEQQPIAQCIETPLEVSLEYTDIPTWSSRKTWAGSDTWIHSAEQSGFCDFSNLILEEAK